MALPFKVFSITKLYPFFLRADINMPSFEIKIL